MALADSVPGVSGGTIAYLLGYYEDFIGSLNAFITFRGEKSERIAAIKKSFFFLLRLGAGWIVGFILAVKILTSVFESNIYQISSLFLGFIVFSIPLIVYEEKESLKKLYNAFFIIIGAAVVVAITLANPSEGGISDGTVNIAQLLYIAFVGMLAISAMVLPGISGSTLLLIFGVYTTIMNSINDLLRFDFSALPVVMAAGIGILIGVVLIIKLVKTALDRFHSQTIFTIIGLMLGSLFAVVKGPESLDTPQAAMNVHNFSILFFLIGGVTIIGLQFLKLFMSKKKTAEESTAKS